MTTTPSLHLFGGAALRDETGAPVSGPAARRHPLALLALLATAPARTMGRSKLAGLLWPESPESRARRRLNSCVHRIRQGLGDDAVLSVGDELRLNTDLVECDVHRFESALEAGDHQRAVELYEGPLLDGFFLKGASEFEKHIERARDRLRTRYLEALEALAEEAAAAGDPSDAARWWRERAQAAPYDSRVTLRLMEALAAAGNRAEAIQVATTHRRLLQDELGASPDPAVEDLAERMKEAPPTGVTSPPTSPAPAELPAPSEHTPPIGSAGGAEAPTVGSEPRSRRLLRPGRIAAALIAIGMASAAVWLFAMGDSEPARPPVEERSVAVLPLNNTTPGGEDAYLAEAMTEEITSALTRVPELHVASRNSASKFDGAETTLAGFARELGVSHVVEGSVQRAGGRVRITVQLIDARADKHVWSETYERELTDLFEVQVDVARKVADRLAASFSERDRMRILGGTTDDAVAYDLYLRETAAVGRSPLDDRIAHLREAVARDSAFWPAWERLAYLYLEKEERGHGLRWADSSRMAIRRAIEHAESSELPRLEAWEAMVFGGDERETIARLRAAVEERRSDLSLVVALGHLLRLRGELPESARWFRHAASLDPLQSRRWQTLFPGYWWAGMYGPAERVLRRAVELDPQRPQPWWQFSFHWMIQGRFQQALAALDSAEAKGLAHTSLRRGFVLWWAGEVDEAAAIFRRFDPDSVSGTPLDLPAPMAHALYASGDSARADSIVARFRQVLASQAVEPFDPEWRVFPRLQLAALEGDTERALELFRTYVERGGRDPTWYLQSPLFAALREDPAFRAELRELERLVDGMRRRMERDLRQEGSDYR